MQQKQQEITIKNTQKLLSYTIINASTNEMSLAMLDKSKLKTQQKITKYKPYLIIILSNLPLRQD